MPELKNYLDGEKEALEVVPLVTENEAPCQTAVPASLFLRDRVNLILSLEVRLRTAFLEKNLP